MVGSCSTSLSSRMDSLAILIACNIQKMEISCVKSHCSRVDMLCHHSKSSGKLTLVGRSGNFLFSKTRKLQKPCRCRAPRRQRQLATEFRTRKSAEQALICAFPSSAAVGNKTFTSFFPPSPAPYLTVSNVIDSNFFEYLHLRSEMNCNVGLAILR